MTLLNGETPVDRVDYPSVPADTSWARFQDGSTSFAFNGVPDPGMPNLDNGAVDVERAGELGGAPVGGPDQQRQGQQQGQRRGGRLGAGHCLPGAEG